MLNNGHLPKIERGIAMPQRKSEARIALSAFLINLKPGESFKWPQKSMSSLYMLARKLKVKISMRWINKKEVRVWRLSE